MSISARHIIFMHLLVSKECLALLKKISIFLDNDFIFLLTRKIIFITRSIKTPKTLAFFFFEKRNCTEH